MRDVGQKFYGKYRGTVVNNQDPEQRGRIQATVPDVTQLVPSTWALPCVPVAGLQMGMFTVPPVGASVWIEFEHGDPDKPVWVGCFWGTAAEVPALSRTAPPPIPAVTLQTPLQTGIVLSDVSGPTGGILLTHGKGAFISVSDAGITISNGRGAVITMLGKTVDINSTALTIT